MSRIPDTDPLVLRDIQTRYRNPEWPPIAAAFEALAGMLTWRAKPQTLTPQGNVVIESGAQEVLPAPLARPGSVPETPRRFRDA